MKMTPNIGDMIESFHRLWDKIETNHAKINEIQQTCQQISKNVRQSNEYRESVEQLSNLPKRQSRKALIAQIKMEQRFSGMLATQNAELKSAIQTHRNTLDKVMQKYREQMSLLKKVDGLEDAFAKQFLVDNTIQLRRDYIAHKHHELPVVMVEICDRDDVLIERQSILIEKLRQQNARMRRSLIVASQQQQQPESDCQEWEP